MFYNKAKPKPIPREFFSEAEINLTPASGPVDLSKQFEKLKKIQEFQQENRKIRPPIFLPPPVRAPATNLVSPTINKILSNWFSSYIQRHSA